MADLLYDVIRVTGLKAEFTGTKLKNKMFGFATDTGEFVAKSAGVYYFFKNFDDLETLLDGKEDSLGFTPENVANKENTTIDNSTVKYPTVNLLKKGLDGIAYPYEDVRGPTGFKDPVDVQLSYSVADRKVTITGNPTVVYRGTDISHLFVNFESEAHALGDNEYWLQYNGTVFEWTLTPDFKQLLIALAYVNDGTVCFRECHGFIHWETHSNLHNTIGTYLRSGGDLSAYVLESTTAANRRPEISQTMIVDEDLPTVNPLLSNTGAQAVYSQLYISGANSTVINTDNSDILPLSGNTPYYNKFNEVNQEWEQVLMATNNSYQKIFVMATPASLGDVCQKSRYLFIQGQEVSVSLPTIQAITPADVNLGLFNTGVSEFVFIGEIIIRYTTAGGGAWRFTEVNKIKGTKASQVKQATGNYLSSVATDDTIDGDGTVGSPMSITNSLDLYVPQTGGEFTGGVSFNRNPVAGAQIIFGGDNPAISFQRGTGARFWQGQIDNTLHIGGAGAAFTNGAIQITGGDVDVINDLTVGGDVSEGGTLLSDKYESLSNKKTDLTDNSDISYPSVKAVNIALDTPTKLVDQGYTYDTVRIGDKIYTVQNFRGVSGAGSEVTDGTDWGNLTDAGWCKYANDSANEEKYGKLYNWYAVDNLVLPAGWRVPTVAEYTELQNYLIAKGHNWDGSESGNKIAKSMASSGGEWDENATAGNVGNDQATNNSSGFSALPGGDRNVNGHFSTVGSNGRWWSATEINASNAYFRNLSSGGVSLDGSSFDKGWGFSVRLVRDVSPIKEVGDDVELVNDLTVCGATILPWNDFIYWGPPTINGSYRQGRDGNNLIIQRREAGAWVTKETTTP